MKDRTPWFNSAQPRQAASMLDDNVTVTRSTFARIAPILVFVSLFLGAGLRLNGLGAETIDHNEIYVPGIRLPEDISIPGPRLTFRGTITSTIAVECHPPGYYLLMLPWTRCFGTSPLAIRLPSAIIDVTTILLIYLLGVRLGIRTAGLLGSFLWATAGLPVYLAQEARMYPLACFLGVLATLLLVESYVGSRSRRYRIIGAYVITILAGLSTTHFYWAILMIHMLYVQLGPIPSDRRSTPQAQWQLFTAALASPLLAIAVFQSGRSSYLSSDVWSCVQAYFRLLYVWHSGETLTVASWLGAAATLGCVSLLIIGVLRMPRRIKTTTQIDIGCPRWFLYAAAVLAFISIEAFAWLTYHRQSEFTWLEPRTGVIVACGAIPLFALAADFVIRRGFPAVWLESRMGAPLGPIWLVVFLAVIPVVLLALISIAIPLLAGRTVSVFGPYLMLIVSVGAVCLCRSHFARGVAVIFLLALNAAGFLEYREQPHSPTDYSTLAARVAPKVQAGDLWFIFRHWATTPIFYYLNPAQYTFIARDHAQVLSKQPHAHVWVLGFDELPPPTRVTDPLRGYRRQDHVQAPGIYADLYVPVSVNATGKTNAENCSIGPIDASQRPFTFPGSSKSTGAQVGPASEKDDVEKTGH